MTNKSKDYHFFASDFVLDRVNVMHLPDNAPIGNTDQIGPDHFLPNPEEIKKFRNCLKIFIARKLVHNISGLSWMKSILPEHIPHDHQEEMSKRSSIFILPIMLKNESKYSDCIGIMDGYVEWINRWYAKAGRGSELEHLQVPVGGDQLTRVRLQGAKALREGCHTQQERFEQLEPVVVEMFHTLQDFLEKLCKKFLKLDKGTDKGTLCHLKMVIQRTNVNGKVKVRFKAHEQFVDVVGTSYLLNLAMEKLNMQTINDSPHHPDMPETIKMWHSNKKEEVFNKFMDDIIDSVFIRPLQQQVTSSSKTADISVIIGMNTRKLTLPVEDGWIKVTVHTPGNRFIISVSTGQVRNGVSVTIPGLTTPVTIQEDASMNDDLHNYAVNFLNWYFVILGMQEATSEGNLELCNIVLKFMTPLFYSHSSLSKYMTECLDYILKTEVMMTPRKSLKVRAASFVNPTGRRGHNKASDMQKENQVLVLKDLIRGLGANKTEKSIVKISKVAPVVESVVDNLLLMTDTTNFVSRHHKRSETEDILEILSVLKNNNPWKVTPGRDLSGFAGICKSPYTFNLELFKTSVANTLTRLKQGVILQHGDCETEDEE
ncbi:uncharacterized protein LOC124128741 isoform X2 [Haliotis rufescens]|nr:uncharacterized protein LOC124128741 isoform X2 [Haliotis rufescens]